MNISPCFSPHFSQNMNNFYTISDFYIAAFILASGKKLVDLDRSNPKKVVFLFDDPIGCRVLTMQYWQGKEVKGIDLADAIRQLKARLYSQY